MRIDDTCNIQVLCRWHLQPRGRCHLALTQPSEIPSEQSKFDHCFHSFCGPVSSGPTTQQALHYQFEKKLAQKARKEVLNL
jgi:hypothetical protein